MSQKIDIKVICEMNRHAILVGVKVEREPLRLPKNSTGEYRSATIKAKKEIVEYLESLGHWGIRFRRASSFTGNYELRSYVPNENPTRKV